MRNLTPEANFHGPGWFLRLVGYDLYIDTMNGWNPKNWFCDSDTRLQDTWLYWFGPFHLAICKLDATERAAKSPSAMGPNWFMRLVGYDIFIEVWNGWQLSRWQWHFDPPSPTECFCWVGPLHISVCRLK